MDGTGVEIGAKSTEVDRERETDGFLKKLQVPVRNCVSENKVDGT